MERVSAQCVAFRMTKHWLLSLLTWTEPNFTFLFCIIFVVSQLNTRSEVCSFNHYRDIEGFQNLKKSRSRDLAHVYLILYFFRQANLCAKFEVSSFNHSRDMEGVTKFQKVRQVTPLRPVWPNFALFRLCPLASNLHAKFEVSSFNHSRDMDVVPKF